MAREGLVGVFSLQLLVTGMGSLFGEAGSEDRIRTGTPRSKVAKRCCCLARDP